MASINLDIGGNTSRLDKDIQKTVNKVYTINLQTKGDQPLGRITGKVNEFNKSLDASNARVIAFGASAGIIFGLQKAFNSLVTSTIEVQKSLQDINVILNVSSTQLNKFGSELFNIAKNTGQSFQEVAKAATEFSRQGLGLAETLKRTNEALILSRLSGLDTVKSVEALTAAVNSFASQAVTATDIVNKFANVDAAFAVSSADLADAISRVGSSAAQSGVSLNELIALVTSAQQTTARGGAVIGNSFKTIFTRLQRGKVIDLLGNLGISDVTAGGEIKSTIQLLQELAKVYDNLGATQQAAIAEQVGGVFQINILKAALADLGKEYSIYNSALNTAESSTDQAIKRNEQLNKTYAAQLNALQQNAKQLASNVGGRVLGPAFERVVGGANQILGGINESDGENVGSILGRGILDGLGQILAGPGLVVIGGILLKLTKDFAKFGLESGKGLLGLNTASEQQRSIQESINQILQKNPKLLELALKNEQGLNQAANSLFASLQKQTIELQKQAQISAQIAKSFYGAGVRVTGGVPTTPTKPGKATGFIPNFANPELLAAKKERYTAQRSFEVNNPVLGRITVNNREKTNAVPVGGYPPGSFVVNPKQLGQVAGIPLESIERMKNKASGFIPNFAKSRRDYQLTDGDSTINFSDKKKGRLEFVDAIESWQKYGSQAKQEAEKIIYSQFPNTESLLKSSNDKAAYDRYSFRSSELQNTLIKKGLGVPDIRYSGQNYIASTLQTMQKNIGLWSDKNKDGFYNHPKAQQFIKQNNLAKKLALQQPGIDKNKKNFILGSATRFATGRFGGKLLPETYKSGKQVNFQKLFASGFIPNFAPIKFPSAGYSADSEQARKDLLRQDYRKNILESSRRSNIKSFRGKNFKQERETAVREAQMNREVYKQVKGVAGGAISTLVYYKNRPGDSPGKMVVTEELEGLNVREVRDHEYTGTESNALTIEDGRIVLEDYNPKSSKRFPFKAKYRKKINELAGALKMPVIERSALTKQLATSRIAAIRNDRSGIYQNSRYAEDDDGFASGFIPNFAQGKNAIDLGDTRTSPALKGKVLSLIHPGISQGFSMTPATASYLGQQYRGLIPVAGINQQVLKGELPDLDKNLGDLLVREANQFGQAIGGRNFLKSAQDLPNFGAAKGAVGVAFEGGLLTLLRQNLQKTAQNAGIDFRQNRITPKLRNLFHGAPGMYDAKYSPELVNDVMSKLLQEAKVGEVKKVKSGVGFGASQALRAEALKNLQGQNLRRGPQLEKAIKEEMARISRTRGLASGFIPNFASGSSAETNRGIPVSQIRAHFDGLGNPIAVTNKKDEPNGLKDAIGRERKGIGMYSRGFVPNFADDVSGTAVGPTIAALITQFGFLGFALKDINQDYKIAKDAIIESTTEQIKADKQRLSSLQKGTQEYNKLNSSITKTTRTLKGLESGKVSGEAFVQSVSNAMLIAAPIIGQTIKNLIGSETKAARATGAGIEGITSAATFAGLAAQIAPRGKGKAATITGLIVSLLGVKDVFDQLATDLPELTRASDEAAQKLSAFENISQQANTALEQILELKQTGQAKEAGKLEVKTIGDIMSQVTDINVASQMIRALENQDPQALKVAIEENTKALREQKEKTERATAVETGIQNVRNLQPGFLSAVGNLFSSQTSIDKANQKRQEKELKEASNIFGVPLASIKSKTGEGRAKGEERIAELQRFATSSASGIEGYTATLEELGYDAEQIEQLVANEGTLRSLLVEVIKKQIETEEAILRNTELGNPIVKQIVDTMGRIRSNYDKYARVITEGTNYQIEANAGIKNALDRITVGGLRSQAELISEFTGEGSTATRQATTTAELTNIDSEFRTAVREPMTEVMKTLQDVLLSSVGSRVPEILTPGKDEGTAVANFAQLQKELPRLLESLNLGNLEDLIGIKDLNLDTFEGFDVDKIIEGLKPTLQGEEAQKGLDTLREKLTLTNSILFEQKRIQQEQKTLLAQQKFTEIAKAFINAAKTSFGGFETFLKDNFTEMSSALNDAATNIKIIGSNPQTRSGQIEFGRQLGILTTELSKIAGMNIGTNLAPEIIGAIQTGQSQYIEDNLNEVFASLEGVDSKISEAFRKTLSEKFDPNRLLSNKELAEKTAEAQTKAQYELVPAINEAIQESAKARLAKDPKGEELLKLLESPASAFLDPQSYTNIALDTANKTLEEILKELQEPTENPPEPPPQNLVPLDANGNPQKPPPPVMGGSAGGYFPAFANSKESIIPNFWEQYKKEKRDQSKYGYSGGKPILLRNTDFNPLKDAIANPMQMALFGGMNSKSLGAAGGYFPNFANSDWGNEAIEYTRRKDLNNNKKSSQLLDPLKFIKNLSPKLAKKLVSRALLPLIQLGQGVTNYNTRRQVYGQGITEALTRTGLEVGLGLAGAATGGFLGARFGGPVAGPAAFVLGAVGAEYGYNAGSIYGDWIFGPEGRPINPPKPTPPRPTPPRPTPPRPTPPIPTPPRPTPPIPAPPIPTTPTTTDMTPAGPKLPSKEVLKAIADRDTNMQLMRWAMGTSAEFKKYDKDYVYTGIKDLYGNRDQTVAGGRKDIAGQIGNLNRQIKSTKDQNKAMALARQRDKLQYQFQYGDTKKAKYLGQLGEGMGAQAMIQKAIAENQSVGGQKIAQANLQGLQRVITDRNGKIIGYSRIPQTSQITPQTSQITDRQLQIEKELGLGYPTQVDPSKLGDLPDKRAKLAEELGLGYPTQVDPSELGKIERTVKKEEVEAGVSRDQVYLLKLPDLKSVDNPEGIGVFNKEDEKSIEEAKKAVERSKFKGGGGQFGGGGASASFAGGYLPNFADPTNNNINVSVGVNITANTPASNINKDELAAQIKTLLEVEVPKLNALKARVDRIGDVVTKVQNDNPGKYNLPPKQIPK